MTPSELIWNGIAAFLTLCIFSFLYKDNPFYRLAEHLVVGVSAGYFAIILTYNGLIPKFINPVFRQGRLYYLLPGILGVLMWTRFSRKWSWLSRYSLAAYMGVATGIVIPLNMYTVMFAIARTAGWIAQWMEMMDEPNRRIGRPRQVYNGSTTRDYVSIDDGQSAGEAG